MTCCFESVNILSIYYFKVWWGFEREGERMSVVLGGGLCPNITPAMSVPGPATPPQPPSCIPKTSGPSPSEHSTCFLTITAISHLTLIFLFPYSSNISPLSFYIYCLSLYFVSISSNFKNMDFIKNLKI